MTNIEEKILETWKGKIEKIKDDEIYATITDSEDRVSSVTFPMSNFKTTETIEIGCSFNYTITQTGEKTNSKLEYIPRREIPIEVEKRMRTRTK